MERFERIGLEDGLSQSVIYDIIQDRKGFMWFATQDGLNRYDGYKFRVYKSTPFNKGMESNFVRKIFEDINGELWIGTLNDGISKYDHVNDNFISYSSGPSNNIVSSICQDKAGNLWFGSWGSGLRKTEGGKIVDANDVFTKNNVEIPEVITALFCTSNGMLVMGTWDSGIYIYELSSQKLINLKNIENDKSSLSNDRIFCIFEDTNRDLWIGTKEGLNKYNFSSNTFETFFLNKTDEKNLIESSITSICQDKNNNLFFGTKNCGLCKYDIDKNFLINMTADENNNLSLSSNNIKSVYCDASNVLWVGTYGGGLNKLDGNRKKFYELKKAACNDKEVYVNHIYSVYKDSINDLWIGTYNKGLFQLREGKIINNFKEDTSVLRNISGSISSLTEDLNKNLWIGTITGGLYKIDRSKNQVQFFSYPEGFRRYRVLSISKSKDNKYLWIGTTEYGLMKFDLRKETFIKSYSECSDINLLKNSEIKFVYTDNSDNLWIGVKDIGLVYFDSENDRIEFLTEDKPELETEKICAISEDLTGNILIATYKGFLIYNKNDCSFKKYTEEQGLVNNDVKGILVDGKNNFWISTVRGLVKFNPGKKIFKNYEYSDGLQSEEFDEGAYFKDENGTMYFGGINGINYFKPEEISDNPCKPKIVITDFQIFNHSIKNSPDNPFLKTNITETKQLNLSYRESVFSFEFAALSYNNSAKNQYAYMMEGFDKEWIESGTRRFVTYTNLEPGEYTFKVKGSNNDGVWNEEETSIKIGITPPFWKTWWFKSLGVVSIVGATGLAYKQKLIKIEKEKKSQEDFSRKLLDSQEAERKRIANELHDTIAHDILITKNKAVLGIKKSDDSEKMKEILNDISDLASSTLNDVRSISYNLHPHQIERLGLTKALKSVINNVSNSSGIKFIESISNIDKLLSKELEINVFRIIQECSNNILKHSNASEASITILRDNKTLLITIWDNGKGISKEKTHGMGLTGIKERVKLYNGNIVIESTPEKGTILVISLPFNNKKNEI